MYQERLSRVVINARGIEHQKNFLFDIELDQNGKVLFPQLMEKIRMQCQIDDDTTIYYFDYVKNNYEKISENLQLPVQSLIHENKIIFHFEQKIPDQLLAYSPSTETIKSKRANQRGIKQAFQLVASWRLLYMWGQQNSQGIIKKYNLDKSAQQIGIPRKSLEDYFLLMRIGKQLKFDFKKHQQDKMGILRKFIKQSPKLQKEKDKQNLSQQAIKIKQDKFLRQLARQLKSSIFDISIEQQIYNVLAIDSPRSSDEDIINQQNQQKQH